MTADDGFALQFEELFAVAYQAAFVVLGDRGDAEDCAQDTLAKALVRWRRVREHPVPWTARVATNAAIDRWRKRARSTPSEACDVENASESSVSDGSFESRDRLVRALCELPRRQREAVVLRHLHDLSEADSATAMRCSVGAVKSATSRGLARLRSLLDDESTDSSSVRSLQGGSLDAS